MCIDQDLFGQVIITYSDVALWLENSRLSPDTIPNRVKAYIKNYNLATKISESKLSGEFYRLQQSRTGFDIDLIKEALQPDPPPEKHPVTGCPLTFHVCKNKACEIYKAIRTRTDRKKRYKQKKSQSAAWLKSFSDRVNLQPHSSLSNAI